MSEPKFTSGPWDTHKWKTDYGWRVIHPAGDAELGNWMIAERIRREKDARLIAAAPELYTALAALLGWHETDPTSLGALTAANHARNILAKARGEAP